MDNCPSNAFGASFEAAFLLIDPEEEFVLELRRSLVEHAKTSAVKSSGIGKLVSNAFFPKNLSRKAWVVIGLVLAVLISVFIFRQPVLAAASRLFGYGYYPPVGFIQLDSARILNNPVKQEHTGNSLTAVRGLATMDHTILWLEYGDTAQPADGAWLETSTSGRINLVSWSWDPNQPNTKGIRLEFPSIPAGVSQTTLSLPSGWRLPLTWIPASQSGLPKVSIVPYGEPSTSSAQASKTPSEICDVQHNLKLCLLAATTTFENTSVLVKVQSANPEITPGDFNQGLVWSTATDPVTLRDERGIIYPMTGQQGETLTFPVISSAEQKVTLTIPAVLATVAIPEQIIQADLGDSPQPGQVIQIDADIQILDTVIRFRKATLVGDGVNSLRLTLAAEPVETKNGITPLMLQMSKPDRVEDLYGSGNLDGSKALFVELIRPQGKISGVLELPIVEASVILAGPFEFSFSLPPMTLQASPTPAVVNPDAFSPAPTPTEMALESYRFSGRLPQSGELLFTVVEDQTTGLYAVSPTNPPQLEQIATLPGQVYQVYLHPDRMGIDYLAGTRVNEDGFTFYRGIQVYTLRFGDSRPTLLVSFSRGPENVKGTELRANWSHDGRLVVFRLSNFAPKQGEPNFEIGWIDLNCRLTGKCEIQYFDTPDGLALNEPQFSPSGYRVLMQGSYINGSGSGAQDIYILEFGPEGIPGIIANLSNTDQIDELVPHWNPLTGQVVALCPTDTSGAQREFCFYDPVTKSRQEGAVIDQHLDDYGIEWNGDQILGIDINHQSVDRNGLFEFRLFDWNGKSGSVLASTGLVEQFVESPDQVFFAFIAADTNEMHLVNISNGEEVIAPWRNVSWVGWAK